LIIADVPVTLQGRKFLLEHYKRWESNQNRNYILKKNETEQ